MSLSLLQTLCDRIRHRWIFLLLLAALLLVLAMGALFYWQPSTTPQLLRLRAWFANPADHADWSITAGERCGDAPMLLPTSGYIGFGWDDSFRRGHRHSGLDIFSPDGATNRTPVVAAYDGYLTREVGWKSTVILRHPDFPAVDGLGIAPGEQIWTYYTHMAARDGSASFVAAAFPPGTRERFVPAGTLLGYQGNWGGSRWQFTGLHLHFSVVKSNADGSYADERVIENTYAPNPLLGLTQRADGIWHCKPAE